MSDEATAKTTGQASPATGTGIFQQRKVLAMILLLTLLIAYLDRVNVSVLLADNAFLQEMGIAGNPVQMGMLMSMFLMAYGIANIVLSPLGDVMGPRRAMSLSIVLWACSLAVGGIASGFTVMLLSRVLLGSGEGLHWPMQSKYVKNWFPPTERGKANSIWLVGLFIGPAIAMPFFTWLLQLISWRASFFVLVGLGLIPLILIWFFTTDHPRENRSISTAELNYIEEALQKEAQEEAQAVKVSVWDNAKTFIFNYRFWLLTIYYVANCAIWWGTMAWLPSYLKVARGFSWASMGALSSLPYFLATITVVCSGYLSDKIGRRAPFIAIALICSSAGIYFGAYAPDNMTAAIYISLGIASLAIGTPCGWSLLQQLVPGRAVGAGAGVMNGVGSILSALAPVLIGVCINISGSYVGGLMFLVGVGVIGAIASIILAIQKY